MADTAPLPPFAVLAAAPCPPVEELALAAAAELWDEADVGAVRALLGSLGDTLAEVAPCGAGLLRRACRLGRVLDDAPGTQAAPEVARVTGAVIVARRAGLRAFPVQGRDRWFVGVTEGDGAVLLDPRAGLRPVDAAAVPPDAGARCSHQLVAALLGDVAWRALQDGRLGRAVRAHELRTLLARPGHDDRPARARRANAEAN